MNKREDISGFYERIEYPVQEKIRADKPHINVLLNGKWMLMDKISYRQPL